MIRYHVPSRVAGAGAVALLLLFPGCGQKTTPTPDKVLEGGGGSSVSEPRDGGGSGLGSETDGIDKEFTQTGVITQDTYLLRRQTDYKNYARVKLAGTATEGDVNTYEDRVQKGRYIPIPAGTKVLRRGKNGIRIEGQEYWFVRVEVIDGSLKDDEGFPARGNVPDSCYENR
jgi:hypothetical protein